MWESKAPKGEPRPKGECPFLDDNNAVAPVCARMCTLWWVSALMPIGTVRPKAGKGEHSRAY